MWKKKTRHYRGAAPNGPGGGDGGGCHVARCLPARAAAGCQRYPFGTAQVGGVGGQGSGVRSGCGGPEFGGKAGFDAIGAVLVLDDLLEMDPDELPSHIFSSHPDTRSRRMRAADNLISFWPAVERIGGRNGKLKC